MKKKFSYMETRKAVKELVLRVGVDNILNLHINELLDKGYNLTDVQNSIGYFRYSPQTAKYRG